MMTTTERDERGDEIANRLEEIARNIESLERAAFFDIAELLAEARNLFRYERDEGGFAGWVESRLSMSRSTADNMLSVYERFGDRESVQRLDTFSLSILYKLAAPSTPQEVLDKVIERAEAGEKVTVAAVKTAIATRRPEPKPKSKSGYAINPAAEALFANLDQIQAFAHVVNTKAARKFITFERQVDLAKQLIEGNIRVLAYQGWVTQWLRQAGRAQSEIDDEERDDLYKEIPGYEIKDEVAAAQSAARAFIDSLLKLEQLWKKLPHNPFFGNIGGTLDGVINMIRQYRRAAGEKSADETERKLTRFAELEHKIRTQESTIEGLRSEIEDAKAAPTPPRDDIGPDSASAADHLRVRSEELERENSRLELKVAELEREVEELRGKLATATGGDMSVSEFQTAHKQWEEAFETQKNIIRDLQNENATLRAVAERERAR